MINSGGWTEGGLMGVGLATVRRAAMGSGYSLKGEHRTAAYHHLLLERQTKADGETARGILGHILAEVPAPGLGASR